MSDEPARSTDAPRWMRGVLRFAAIYNLAWGLFVILFPCAMFQWTGIEPPNYPGIWQCVGMVVGVYGIGYWIAASDPARHWPIVLVGLLGKIFGPIGFVMTASRGELPWSFGWTILTNDAAWWIPFALMLLHAYEVNYRREPGAAAALSPEQAMRLVRAANGATVAEASDERPLLLVFLRHLGCTFCREALADVSARRDQLRAAGVGVGVVHMGFDAEAVKLLAQYGLSDAVRVNDDQRVLYRAFNLQRAKLSQLVSLRVWLRGFYVALVAGHGFGGLLGDSLQMPGTFVVWRGSIIRAFRHGSPADRPDYVELAQCSVPGR